MEGQQCTQLRGPKIRQLDCIQVWAFLIMLNYLKKKKNIFAVNKSESMSPSILQKPVFEIADMNVMRPGGSIGYLGCSDLVGEH